MSNDVVRFGVVGVGAIGPSHVYAINNTEGARLGAVCDLREEAAAKLAGENGVPHFTNIDDMLNSGLVDAVSICIPSGLHLDAVLKSIAAGKHVLCEKPLEITTDRIDEIIAAGRKKGVKVACSLQCRFTPLSKKLKKLIDGGLLGEIYSGSAYSKWYRDQAYYDSANWRGTWKIDGGGCLMNQGIHIVDLFLWFMGDADSVVAFTETKGRNVEVETLALAMVKFANGSRGSIESTTLSYPGSPRYIEMIGSRGTIAFGPDKLISLDLIDATPEETAFKEQVLAEQAEAEKAENARTDSASAGTAIPDVNMGHQPIFEDFVKAIQKDSEPWINGEEARKAVSLINGVYESGRNENRLVKLS